MSVLKVSWWEGMVAKYDVPLLSAHAPIWSGETETVKFICLTPGYDRHFTICEKLGIKMISVSFNDDGPDMETIFSLVENDSSIKGIWCVPKYSNPTGHTYSEKTVKCFAKLGNVAGANFRIIWDNAYAVHHLEKVPDTLGDIQNLCNKEGTRQYSYVY